MSQGRISLNRIYMRLWCWFRGCDSEPHRNGMCRCDCETHYLGL